MRISDWSSDVCSSDLKAVDYAATSVLPIEIEAIGSNQPTLVGSLTSEPSPPLPTARLRISLAGYGVVGQALAARLCHDPRFEIAAILVRHPERERAVPPRRSEEHTSELQSPMRISYAVFCLKHTKNNVHKRFPTQ